MMDPADGHEVIAHTHDFALVVPLLPASLAVGGALDGANLGS